MDKFFKKNKIVDCFFFYDEIEMLQFRLKELDPYVSYFIVIEGKVDFANSTNLLIAGSALIIGIADMSWTRGDYTFNGIINATLVAILGYRILHSIADARGNR